MRRAGAGTPATLQFREKWRIALAQVRAILHAGFTITGVVVDADYGSNAEFRTGLERLGLSYGVAIRGEALCAVVGVPGSQTATAIAQSAPEDAWKSVTWGTGTAGPLTARFCALRVRPTKGRGDRWLLCERSATDERKYYLLRLRRRRHWSLSWRSPAAAGRSNSNTASSKTTSGSIISRVAPIMAGRTMSS
jgi:SRSO17 transposase